MTRRRVTASRLETLLTTRCRILEISGVKGSSKHT